MNAHKRLRVQERIMLGVEMAPGLTQAYFWPAMNKRQIRL